MNYSVSTDTLSKLVEHIKEVGTEQLDLSTITNFLDEIRKEDGNNIKRCRWTFERGQKVGQQCPNNTVEGLPYCKTCKNKVKAKSYMKQHGYMGEEKSNGPNRPNNSLRDSIKGKISKIDRTKYYAIPVPNHPEYTKEQTFNFILRTTVSGEVYTEAIYDDTNKTLRNLATSEIKIAISKKYLVSENGATDLVSLKELIYPSKSHFCGNDISIEDALDSFKLETNDE
uniref:Uncharacterized protein n=1 Tax=Pithovirus LCPAC401 TaxID=2506595 RepID=A0A481Z9I1_9VIRU|nr:MAG: uncharacterized protein LCPAC401_01760 [Pithovirus LCPAC401]